METNTNEVAAVATLYTVADMQTGNTSGRYKTRSAAMRAADRKDMAYGAIRYAVRELA